MSSEAVGPRARLALAAALGTGVVIGAAGLVVYQVRDRCPTGYIS